MTGWLRRLRKSDSQVAGLARSLSAYPSYVVPHPGPGTLLTVQQAQENLDYLLGQRERRLEALGQLLQGYGIDIKAALAGHDPRPLLDQLHAWANEHWPGSMTSKRHTLSSWVSSSRQGDEIVYSMLTDVAILLGELIRRRRPAYQWTIDLDEVNGRDGMLSYRRPVLQIPRSGAMPAPVVLDLEDIVVGRYLQPNDPTQRLINGWARLVEEAVSGAHEAPWQAR